MENKSGLLGVVCWVGSGLARDSETDFAGFFGVAVALRKWESKSCCFLKGSILNTKNLQGAGARTAAG